MSSEFARPDGRLPDQLRPIKMAVGILDRADGSAYVEQGNTKVIVAVYGPRELHPRHKASPEAAVVRCRYHMAPFSTRERKSPNPSRREVELSKVIKDALSQTIFLERFPRTSIDVFIEVLEADGGTRCASINACSLALANAGIPIRDLISAVAVGKYNGHIILDLNDEEDEAAEADMPVAIMPSFNKVVLLQLNGVLTEEEFKQAFDLAVKGCMEINRIQREALRSKYLSIKGEEDEDV